MIYQFLITANKNSIIVVGKMYTGELNVDIYGILTEGFYVQEFLVQWFVLILHVNNENGFFTRMIIKIVPSDDVIL